MNKTDMIYTVRTMSSKFERIIFIVGITLLGGMGAISYMLNGFIGWVVTIVYVVLVLTFFVKIKYLAYRITRYFLSGMVEFNKIFGTDFEKYEDTINFR